MYLYFIMKHLQQDGNVEVFFHSLSSKDLIES